MDPGRTPRSATGASRPRRSRRRSRRPVAPTSHPKAAPTDAASPACRCRACRCRACRGVPARLDRRSERRSRDAAKPGGTNCTRTRSGKFNADASNGPTPGGGNTANVDDWHVLPRCHRHHRHVVHRHRHRVADRRHGDRIPIERQGLLGSSGQPDRQRRPPSKIGPNLGRPSRDAVRSSCSPPPPASRPAQASASLTRPQLIADVAPDGESANTPNGVALTVYSAVTTAAGVLRLRSAAAKSGSRR